MEFYCLGSGSSGNAYVIRENNKCLLVECGFKINDLVRKLHQRNIALTDIQAVAVTHFHSDHSKAVDDFDNYGIDIFSPNSTNKIFNTSWLEISSFPVSHDVPAVGFSMTNKNTGEHILFINDTSVCDLPYEVIKTKYDYIFIECNHTRRKLNYLIEHTDDETKLRKYARQKQYHLSLAGTKKMLSMLDLRLTKAIYLMHLSEGASEPETMQQVIEGIFEKKTYLCQREGDFR